MFAEVFMLRSAAHILSHKQCLCLQGVSKVSTVEEKKGLQLVGQGNGEIISVNSQVTLMISPFPCPTSCNPFFSSAALLLTHPEGTNIAYGLKYEQLTLA